MSQIQIFSESGSSPATPNVNFIQGNTGIPIGPNPVNFTINLIGNTVQGVSVAPGIPPYTQVITVADATTTQKGVVTLPTQELAISYTNVTTAMSPYTVTETDYFISCDATAGPITIRLPNTTTNFREFVIKDRVGIAATNNVIVTTVGGAVNIDGATSYTFTDNFESLETLFNGTSYETF